MMVYYGIKIIKPDYICILAFIVSVVFQLLLEHCVGAICTIEVVICVIPLAWKTQTI